MNGSLRLQRGLFDHINKRRGVKDIPERWDRVFKGTEV
jgi:hypothetical protein